MLLKRTKSRVFCKRSSLKLLSLMVVTTMGLAFRLILVRPFLLSLSIICLLTLRSPLDRNRGRQSARGELVYVSLALIQFPQSRSNPSIVA